MYEIDQEEMNPLRIRLSLKIDIWALRDKIESMKLQIERQQAILADLNLIAPSSGTLILTETIYRDPQSVNFFSIQPGAGMYVNKGNLIGYLINRGLLSR